MTVIKWNLALALKLCRTLEFFAPRHGGHVALTGGCLYKDGERKDVDVICYRSFDEEPFDWAGFSSDCETLGIEVEVGDGFCKKARLGNLAIDFFDPFGVMDYEEEEDDGPLETIQPEEALCL